MKIDARIGGKLLAVTLIAAVAGLGCHKRPSAMTPLPGRMGEKAPPGPEPRDLLASGNQPLPGETPAGFPTGPGHPNWNEDLNAFKSDTVHFDFDSSVVKASEKSKVASVGTYLKA